MRKITLKYFAVAFALVFISASVYCSVEAFTGTIAELVISHHHNDGAESHGHSTPVRSHGHHHGDGAAPETDGPNNDFCCSQINGIPSKPFNATSLAHNTFSALVASDAEQTFNFDLFSVQNWLLYDKAPPFPHFALFYILNFPPHAPPLSPSC